MTAKELHDLTAPLYAKHPSAKPDEIEFFNIPTDPQDSFWHLKDFVGASVTNEHAYKTLTGHIFEWLCRKGNAKTVTCVNERWYVHDWRSSGRGSTLLHALVEAAMEVPVC